MTDELPSNVGVSALGGTLSRMVRGQVTRQRPQTELATVTEDLGLMPNSWNARPWSWGRFTVANHLEIHPGDHVAMVWMNGRPMVTDLVGMTDEDERNADHMRRRIRELERRVTDLEAAFAAHVAGHP